MKKIPLVLLLNIFMIPAWAQNSIADSTIAGTVTVSKDPRIEILGKKMAEYNESLANKLHSTKGYRLMILSTNDRARALQVRSQLLQLFPDQSIYMIFQSPYIKLKFGNFLEKSEADDYRKQITAAGIVAGNIYIVPEMVEVKAEKLNQTEEQQ
ncbi:MAG: SPOR domain-containing protein [Ferruginibacter sp.]